MLLPGSRVSIARVNEVGKAFWWWGILFKVRLKWVRFWDTLKNNFYGKFCRIFFQF